MRIWSITSPGCHPSLAPQRPSLAAGRCRVCPLRKPAWFKAKNGRPSFPVEPLSSIMGRGRTPSNHGPPPVEDWFCPRRLEAAQAHADGPRPGPGFVRAWVLWARCRPMGWSTPRASGFGPARPPRRPLGRCRGRSMVTLLNHRLHVFTRPNRRYGPRTPRPPDAHAWPQRPIFHADEGNSV